LKYANDRKKGGIKKNKNGTTKNKTSHDGFNAEVKKD
jgi:hypothetical protein